MLVTTGGYIGDAPPYQGHVVSISARGTIVHVWNSLCSNRHALIVPRTCAGSDSAIWGRGGAVVEPGTGRLLVATGNAPWDGRDNWGDSVLELSPNASTLLQSYTPTSQQQLNQTDADLGSASPALLPGGLVLQGGKDGLYRLLSLAHLNGRDHKLGRLGGELQTLRTPGGAVVLTAPAVFTTAGHTDVAVANDAGTAVYRAARAAPSRGVVDLDRRHEPGRGRRAAVRVRPPRRWAQRVPAERVEADRDAAGGCGALELADRRGRAHRAARGKRERPPHARRSRHLAAVTHSYVLRYYA